MVVRVEGTQQILLPEADKGKLIKLLEEMIVFREEKVTMFSQRIDQYEKKRQAEEAIYQSMGPIRRLLAAKRPEHHLAVEHMVYIKRPLQEIREIQAEILQIQQVYAAVLREEQELFIPHHLFGEISEKYGETIK